MLGTAPIASSRNTEADSLTALTILENGVRRIEEELVDQPEIQARMYDEVADIYHSMGMSKEAEPLYERALRLYREHKGPTDPAVANSLYGLASSRYLMGNSESSDSLFAQWEDLVRQLPQEASPEQAERNSHHLGRDFDLLQAGAILERFLTDVGD